MSDDLRERVEALVAMMLAETIADVRTVWEYGERLRALLAPREEEPGLREFQARINRVDTSLRNEYDLALIADLHDALKSSLSRPAPADALVRSVHRAARRIWALSAPEHGMMMTRADDSERIMREEILGETFPPTDAALRESAKGGKT